MNPPYSGNLHLKILSHLISLYPDAEAVNLSPIRWLQDPLAEYKKNSDWKKFEDIRAKITSLEPLLQKQIDGLFGIQFNAQIGIYYCTKDGGFDYSSLVDKDFMKIYRKCISKTKWTPVISQFSKRTKKDWTPVCLLGGHVEVGGFGVRMYRDRYWWFEDDKCMSPRFKGKTFEECKSYNMMSPDKMTIVEFDSGNEAANFYKYISSDLFSYLTRGHTMDGHIYPSMLAYVDDYTHPWTNEDLYRYFDLTEEEIKVIEETMEKYK